MIKFSIHRLCIAIGLIAGLVLTSPLSALAREPLLIPGKSTLYQRVLTRPDAALYSDPGGQTAVETFAAFEVFFVYDRKDVGGTTYVEVGRSLEDSPEGWFAESKTIAWKQAIVLGFNNPANRERALIFRSKEALEDTLSQESVTARMDQLRLDAQSGNLPEDSPLISIEPSEFVDIENEFYVLPILEAESIRLPTSLPAKLLQIASVPAEANQGEHLPVSREEALRNFRIGITFVIDTTRSMKPYVDEVKDAISRLRDRIAGSPEADRFRFGLVAFRDNTDLVPELQYVTKVFLPLEETSTADKFITAIDKVDTANTNSSGYDEDSIAGVSAASAMNWGPFGGRFIVLITDAGPRVPGPDAAAQGLAPAQLQTELETTKGIALFTLHLKHEAGGFDHEYAEQAYRTMSRFDGSVLYYPIEGADRDAFGQQIDVLAGELEAMVSQAVDGRMREAQDQAPDIGSGASRVGRAMQLAYLGSARSSQAPDVFKGWLTDRDPLDRRAFPVTPYILMSKNELSTLHDVVEEAIRVGTEDIQEGGSDAFFTRLKDAVALISRRPEAVQQAGNLGNLLGEYLADLPYNSEIVNITAEDWRDMSPIRERQLLDTLRSKIIAYERIHDNTSRWHPIKPGAPAGEFVTVVPLSLMP